ncbi:Crp/Fnr family transcriptional regulator [Porphyromonadaceae bacterium]
MDFHALSRSPLFSKMSNEEMESLFVAFKIDEVKFKKGEILAMQDEPVNRLIILIRGSVKAEMADPSGKVTKVEDIFSPYPIAILFLFGENNRFPVQATARESTDAIIIPKKSFLQMLSKSERLLKNYLDLSANYASRLSRKLYYMSFRTIRQRLAMYILDLSTKSESDTIMLDRSKASLAEYFGVSRPSVEREITNLQKEGFIQVDKKQITILRKKELYRMVRG